MHAKSLKNNSQGLVAEFFWESEPIRNLILNPKNGSKPQGNGLSEQGNQAPIFFWCHSLPAAAQAGFLPKAGKGRACPAGVKRKRGG
jgi:hypothetical protein